jgi:hypothetical protein
MVKPPKLKKAPELLITLLSEDSPAAKKFRLNIRSYNNLLSFASKGISGKLFENGNILNYMYCTALYCIVLYCTVLHCIVLYCTLLTGPGDIEGRRRGPPLYKMTGQMYHCLTNMFPADGQLAAFSQLYIHDSQEDHRILQNRNTEVCPIPSIKGMFKYIVQTSAEPIINQ